MQQQTTLFEEKSDYFLKYNCEFFWRTDLGEKMGVTLNLTGQVGLTLIPEKEQFSIGGSSTVRGYDTGVKRGNHGYCLRMELHEQTPRWIQGFFFMDQGGAFLHNTPVRGNILTSLGLGVNMQFPKNITAQLLYGQPVRGKAKFHLSVQAVYY
jgi:hemolysin activation/secretion protein